MSNKWVRTSRRIDTDGTTITYECPESICTIESRKRHIPHAGGRPGTWDHTDFYLFKDGMPACKENGCHEFATLRAAKAYAEKLMGGQ